MKNHLTVKFVKNQNFKLHRNTWSICVKVRAKWYMLPATPTSLCDAQPTFSSSTSLLHFFYLTIMAPSPWHPGFLVFPQLFPPVLLRLVHFTHTNQGSTLSWVPYSLPIMLYHSFLYTLPTANQKVALLHQLL